MTRMYSVAVLIYKAMRQRKINKSVGFVTESEFAPQGEVYISRQEGKRQF